MYFDTHAHYDDNAFDMDRDGLLASLPAQGISMVLNAGCDRATSEAAMRLSERHEHVFAAVGWHPHEAKTLCEDGLSFLREAAGHKKVVAIGEIGLDYHYDHSPREIQRERFVSQLELALELDLPVIIHDREAHQDCMEIISRYEGVRGVFHCYSGSAEMAERLLEMGWHLSFTGAVTFKNARKALETIKITPTRRLMLETDCPYLAPVPFRGKRCDSTMLPYIAEAVGNVLGITAEETAALTYENGRRLFQI